MTFLPIVDRELRTRARRVSTYWLRCGAALVASLIAGTMMIAALVFGPSSAGKAMFVAMAWPAWLFCLIEGLRNTADCLSAEKREGTLGLLFLTDLKGYDVALGKFIASSVGAFFTLLATVPCMALPLLWGGVTAGEFWRMALVLTNTLFFSLTAGLFVSAISRQERQAWLGSMLLVVFFTVGLPVGAGVLGGGGSSWLMTMASPWTGFSNVFDAEYTAAPEMFWNSVWIVHCLGWLGLALASCLLPRSWQEKKPRTRPRRKDYLGTALSWRGAQVPDEKGLLPVRPMTWLATRHDRRRHLVWLPILIAALAGVLVWIAFGDAQDMPWAVWAGSIGVHTLLTVWVAWEACHSFGELRQSGLLELLLVTPVHVREIIQGQERALRRLFLGPVFCLLVMELALLWAYYVRVFNRLYGGDEFIRAMVGTLLVAVSVSVFVLDLLAVTRVGMWLSLTSRRPAQAWGRTVLWVEVIPLLTTLPAMLACCGVATPGVLMAKSILFCSWASGKLSHGFRAAAAQQYSATEQKWWRWK